MWMRDRRIEWELYGGNDFLENYDIEEITILGD